MINGEARAPVHVGSTVVGETTQTSRGGRRWLRRLLVAALLALAALIAGAVVYVHWLGNRVAEEYETARTIRLIKDYVRGHGGQWPRSWEDLPGGKARAKYSIVRFDLTRDELLENKELIYTAVLPRQRIYMIYPHAREQLDSLWKAMREAQATTHAAERAERPATREPGPKE